MNNFKKNTMRKIYLIWFFRKIFSLTTAKVVAILVLVDQLAEQIFVAKVFENWSSIGIGLQRNYDFFQSAVLNTGPLNQVLMLGVLTLSVLLVQDFVGQRRSHSSVEM